MPRHTSVTFTAGAGARRFELTEGRQLIIGRSSGADLQVNSPRLSRKHAAVKLDARGLNVEDLGSANGTYVNGQRVQQALLRPGDIVMVGGVAIRVDFDQTLVPDLDLRCERCGRLVSMARCEEGQVFEMGRQFLCQECATIVRHQDLTQAEQELVAILREEGYQVGGKSPLSTGLVPVFEASRVGIERPVAIKALPLVSGISPKKVARFQTEARAAAKVRHPNVIEIYDIKQHPRALYIVMEHVKGDLLLQTIEKRGPLDHQAGLRVGLLVARALRHAHEQGIVHRDLKPGGIVLTPDGQPKVADFGLAKDLWSLTGHMTGPEETLGTVRYMPPEQVKNAREADHRADYYSLGATLYHVLTGSPPYTQVHELELMGRVLNGTLPPFDPTRAGLPRPISTLLARLMARDPRERPQTAEEVLAAFGEAITELAGIKGYKGDPELLLSMPAAGQMESTWQNVPAPPKPGGVSAVFEREELLEYLGNLATHQKTGLLSVVSQELSGHMALDRGRLRAAITNRKHRDREAVLALLLLKSGQFQFVPQLPPGFVPEVDLDLRPLMVEAARLRDERSSRRF